MLVPHPWRTSRARLIHILPKIAIGAAVPLLAGAPFAGEAFGPLLNTLATMSFLSGFMILLARWQLRLLLAQGEDTLARTAEIDRKVEEASDNQMMMVGAAVSESLRAHVEPDSPWRLKLIKDIAGYINGENEMTLAAIEGTIVDLAEKVTAMRAELDRGQRGGN